MSTRIGFVGAGAVSRRHAAMLTRMPGVRVAAVTDVDAHTAADFAARFAARMHPDHRSLLRDERLDAVYVCVPPFAHGEPEEAVIARGLPLFVEKPVARDLG